MLKIAACSTEAVPFAKTGGLADVVGALPFAMQRLGAETIVILPGYGHIFKKYNDLELVFADAIVRFHEGYAEDFDIYCKEMDKVKFYFIKKDRFFDRPELYGGPQGDYEDNHIRFGFFAKASLELLKKIGFKAHILHLHDYHSAMCAFFVALEKQRQENSFFQDTKTVFTIHNLAYQGIYDAATLELLGIDRRYLHMDSLEFYGKINYMKGGIAYSDKITTVSPTYAREIVTKEFGYMLDGMLRARADDLSGIINGIDYAVWDPKKDKALSKNYGPDNRSGKMVCKKELLDGMLGSTQTRVPVIGMVSRLSQQKGLDILADAFADILENDVFVVVLGTGDEMYMDLLEKISRKHKDKFRLYLAFSDEMARKIYGGSDLFLMPSQYEPCGLGQLISLKYGTIPIVSNTGGLADTILNIETEEDICQGGQGFKFFDYSAESLYGAVKRALLFYHDQDNWEKIVANAMHDDFSWDYSAKKYMQLFTSMGK